VLAHAVLGVLPRAALAAGMTDRLSERTGPQLYPGILAAVDAVMEITRLICAGLTNKQVGTQLFIAQLTVDTHVGHMLATLGRTNRAQIAALTSTRNPAVEGI
jgi:ATP/maltotriose-dependent transcriptional regulator MalT